QLFRLQVICLRFFTVYGPRQRPDLAIRKFTALIEEGKPLPIFGDGSTARDYTHVSDIVAGILASLDYSFKVPSDCAPFEVFNLGNSHAVDRKSTRLNSSHDQISYAVFCLKKKTDIRKTIMTTLSFKIK